ncbi:hypothetical protein WwSim0229 [Wolbachia endosymbiont of Drosophila simulans]|nr:hypothetical protein WwSim0229 [Wolbachia endosymbiont of Drosophila simulans]
MSSFLPLYITPCLSHSTIFLAPMDFSISKHAIPAAPAPFIMILTSSNFFPTISRAFSIPAATTTAVPCWSSWNTGISISSFRRFSIIKQSGDLISSKFIPPQLGPRYLTALIKSSIFSVPTSISTASISAKRLNKTALPSMTGFAARGPILPSPSTAVPFEMTATQLLFAV